HAGNVAETRTLKAMLEAVLQRFAVERVIIVADRGLREGMLARLIRAGGGRPRVPGRGGAP
ncbi:MAG: hypothetical protein ACP5NI_08415, partial [Acetobacteraceae bacterium]